MLVKSRKAALPVHGEGGFSVRYFLIAMIHSNKIMSKVKKSYLVMITTPSQGPGFNRQPLVSTLAQKRYDDYIIGWKNLMSLIKSDIK